ncbi:hypothetical protein [Streptomyces sp. Ag109_G2-15]|uniref:hypothetical protein n=1 Tax=Streptomyces sp. Ag109_G2-15 TaxID=1938850 RepID=UPI000BC5A19C|nr:hypothetical protein [Streptomyces sp. Ag109_G2-15]SOD82720.1 hypothetical protein SAMN06272765_0684 [Streptomyces sp. Ag109_G2-15]
MSGGGSGPNLEANRDALKKFVGRVDAVLRQLEESAGNPTRVGAQTVRPASLTSGPASIFPEAHDLYNQYKRVHKDLTDLSKSLHLQIEAMGIAVDGASNGFDGLEEEQRQRFWAIQEHIQDSQDVKDGKQHTGNNAKSGAGL